MSTKKTTVMDGLLAVHCGTPMVGTIMFSGTEFYCVKCGATQGIFGTTDTESTLELQDELQKNEKKFEAIAGDLIPAGAQFDRCGICQEKKEDHRLHASQQDLDKSDVAYKLFFGGILEEEPNATH